jgi:aldose 1-epimerase
MPTTAPPLVLTHGALRCDISPALGGCIAGLWCDGIAVLRSTPGEQLQSVRLSGSYPLVPYSNRQAFGRMRWAGVDYPLTPNFPPEPHAIHGVGWERAWSVADSDAQSATLHYQHTPDASWPFAFDATQIFHLERDPHNGDALELTLRITNTAPVAAPVGLGWHPYFAKHPGARVAFAAQGRWEMDADKLPTHRLPHVGLQADCATLTVDHCFDGWSGTVHLQDDLLDTRISSDLAQLVVFTTPARENIAVEPVSHTNNALNLLALGTASAGVLGVRVLQPQETFSARMRIAVRRHTPS